MGTNIQTAPNSSAAIVQESFLFFFKPTIYLIINHLVLKPILVDYLFNAIWFMCLNIIVSEKMGYKHTDVDFYKYKMRTATFYTPVY